MWFDSHCHLEKFSDRGDLQSVLGRAYEANVLQMVTVGTRLKDWNLYAELAAKYDKQINYSVGLHPCYVNGKWKEEISTLRGYWETKKKPVALGEIGLDYFHLPKNKLAAEQLVLLQKEAFRMQLSIAAELKSPVIIHSRNAFDECVQIIDQSEVEWNRVVFHCFSEGMEEMREIKQRGGWVSFTGILTYPPNEALRDALREADLERIMIETDSPYLSPIPKRGKENEPSHLPFTGRLAAEILNLSERNLAIKVYENTVCFYGCHQVTTY